jgi:hypothetical protein
MGYARYVLKEKVLMLVAASVAVVGTAVILFNNPNTTLGY